MKSSRFVIALWSLLPGLSAFAATVMTDKGPVAGEPENGAEVFRAIPYAAPPVGPLRWKPPQVVREWTAARDNTRFSPVCPQTKHFPVDSPIEPMDEDCLYLNLWRPDRPITRPLPVMVWIYGGGLESGSASIPLYHGDALAEHDVIVVTFNYRLGALGFLAHPALSAESTDHTSGNYGLLDQVAALKWVHQNIAAFGGDPSNVTLFGQSSGSISISVLSVLPQTATLFQRAIGESGGLFEPLELADNFSLPGAEQEGSMFAEGKSLDELRAIPAEALIREPFFPHFVVDGSVLPESPHAAYRAHHNRTLDLLVGYNTDDGAWALNGHDVSTSSMSAMLSHDFPPLLVQLIGPPQPTSDAQAYRFAASFERDMRFGWDMAEWSRLHAEQSAGTTFFYSFSGPTDQPDSGSHGSEMAYVFGHPPGSVTWTEADRALSVRLISYWTHFATTGTLDGTDSPPWPNATADHNTALEIGDASIRNQQLGMDFVPRIGRAYGLIQFVAAHIIALLIVIGAIIIAAFALLIRTIARRRRRPA